MALEKFSQRTFWCTFEYISTCVHMHVYYIIYQDLFFSVTHLSLAGVLWQCIFIIIIIIQQSLGNNVLSQITVSYLRHWHTQNQKEKRKKRKKVATISRLIEKRPEKYTGINPEVIICIIEKMHLIKYIFILAGISKLSFRFESQLSVYFILISFKLIAQSRNYIYRWIYLCPCFLKANKQNHRNFITGVQCY